MEMDEHFYILIKSDALTTDPPIPKVVSMHFFPGTRAGSPELSVSRPPAFPPHCLGPQVSGSLRGVSSRVAGPRLRGRGTARLPGEPFLEAHGARRRWSSYYALGTDSGPGGGRGRAVGPLRCGALRCAAGSLRPCCRAAGSAESGAPPTAAAALRVPPSRCRVPGP